MKILLKLVYFIKKKTPSNWVQNGVLYFDNLVW